MTHDLVLASGSATRAGMLKSAGLSIKVHPARIDEEVLKQALIQGGGTPRDVADALAESKARKVAGKFPDGLVLGCDQVLAIKDRILSKPADAAEAIEHLRLLSGNDHMLLSAAVLFENGAPVWRHVGVVRMRMRHLSESYRKGYVARNWDSIRDSVGAYKLEEEGVRLFSAIEGDHFNVLGLPLLELLSYLTLRGILQT